MIRNKKDNKKLVCPKPCKILTSCARNIQAKIEAM